MKPTRFAESRIAFSSALAAALVALGTPLLARTDSGAGCPSESTTPVSTLGAAVDAAIDASAAPASAPAARRALTPDCSASFSKASAKVLAAVDGASTRILLTMPAFPQGALRKSLLAAAARGVDVHVYVPRDTPADGTTVIDREGLESAGVDVMVDVENNLPRSLLVADDAGLGWSDACAVESLVGADEVAGAAAAFAAEIAEAPATPPAEFPRESVKLLPAGSATQSEIAGLIAAATKSIDLEIYQLQDPAITDALIAAEARGVKVRVMLEPRTVGAANFKPMSARLKAAGISVQPTPPNFDSHHNVDHAKFLVLDGSSILFGTGNLVRSGIGGIRADEFNHRDFWIHDSRKASVTEATKLFESDWNRTPTSAAGFKNLVVTPDNADRSVLDLIGGARTKVWVWNQSLSDPGVTDALLAAKARGADVRVLLGFQPGFGRAPAPNQPALDTLAAAGIPAGFYTRNYLHAKAVITENGAFVGSQNFTNGGLKNNREVGEIVDDPAVLTELGRMFQDDEKNPKP